MVGWEKTWTKNFSNFFLSDHIDILPGVVAPYTGRCERNPKTKETEMNKKVLAALVSTLAFGTVSVAKAEDKPADAKGAKAEKGKKGDKGDKGAEHACKGDKGGAKSCKGEKGAEHSCKGEKGDKGGAKSCGEKSCGGKK